MWLHRNPSDDPYHQSVALLASFAIVYRVMVATFRSLVQPLILLVSIPFAATGALILLLATGTHWGCRPRSACSCWSASS